MCFSISLEADSDVPAPSSAVTLRSEGFYRPGALERSSADLNQGQAANEEGGKVREAGACPGQGDRTA